METVFLKRLDRIPDFTVVLSPVFPQRDVRPFPRVPGHWRKEKHQTFWGLLDTGSGLIDSKRPQETL